MCGIAGYAGPLPEADVVMALRAMLAAQVHRGPDDEGQVVFGPPGRRVGLGSRRLAVLDPAPSGHQPMVSPGTGDVLVFNGEIYNFRELRRELERRGHAFRSTGDTEVLLTALTVWGREALDRLRGMFALAFWDEGRGRLLLARDHLGIKPLYWAAAGGGLLFASETRSLLASGLATAAVDRRGLAGYLAYGAPQEPLTIFAGVRPLAPGSWAEFDGAGRETGRGVYWRAPDPEPALASSAGDPAEEGRAILAESVRRHLVSDVPLGVFLSSGLDSTAVAGLAREAQGDSLLAATVSFPELAAYDEAPVARESARRLGIRHLECPVDSGTALRWTADALEAMDQPAMDGLNAYIVSRAVREAGLVVALSGQGGDEVFGGYSSFRAVPRWRRWLALASALPPGARAGLARAIAAPRSAVQRGKAVDLARAGGDLLPLYFHYRRLLSDAELAALGFRPRELGLAATFHVEGADGRDELVPGDPAASIRRLETRFYLGNVLLRDGDVFGMASSLEVRVPLLDRDVVDWAFRLPGSVFLGGSRLNKPLLRRMAREFFSADQERQAKRGFTPPLHLWMRGPLRELMESSVDAVRRSGLMETTGVERVRTTFLREPGSAAWSRLWALVALGSWLSRSRTGAPRVHAGT